MTYDEIIAYYGTQSQAARSLGIPQPTLAIWKHRGKGVPILAQLQIEAATKRKLRADPLPALSESA